jgi:hypothetical protein
MLLLLLTFAAGPEPLFDGKSLAGWVVEGARTFKDAGKDQPVWVAEDGMIRCRTASGGYGFLRHDRKMSDFVLRLEYRFEKGKKPGNSGIGLRAPPFDPKRSTETRPSSAGYEIQLVDDAGKKPDRHSTGSLYRHVAPTENAAKPAGEWNNLEVECAGPRIRITLNGKLVLDVDQTKVSAIKDRPREGYISLQCHGSRVDFRNITVRPLTPGK